MPPYKTSIYNRRFNKKKRLRPVSKDRVKRVVPNIITVMALCTGLSSLRFAFSGHWELAVVSILVAGILDTMDGRIARLLGSVSDFGAELDSLSDFISFGVAPAMINYLFILEKWNGTGWGIILMFSTCTALRLARFNVNKDIDTEKKIIFFTGVPAPAGAFLGLLPVMLSFAIANFQLPVSIFALFMGLSSLLMVSRIPTISLKNIHISHHNIVPYSMGVVLFSALLLSIPWATLCTMGFLYLCSIPFSFYSNRKHILQQPVPEKGPFI